VGKKAKLGWTWTSEKDGYIGLYGLFFFFNNFFLKKKFGEPPWVSFFLFEAKP
jgi:hypothetical protein